MPAIMELDILLSLDSVTDADKIKEEFEKIKHLTEKANENINKHLNRTQIEFMEKSRERIFKIEKLWDDLTESFSELKDPTITETADKRRKLGERYGADENRDALYPAPTVDDGHTNDITYYPPPEV